MLDRSKLTWRDNGIQSEAAFAVSGCCASCYMFTDWQLLAVCLVLLSPAFCWWDGTSWSENQPKQIVKGRGSFSRSIKPPDHRTLLGRSSKLTLQFAKCNRHMAGKFWGKSFAKAVAESLSVAYGRSACLPPFINGNGRP